MKFLQKLSALSVVLLLVLTLLTPQQAAAVAYDPNAQQEGTMQLPLRFWQDEKPDVGFYINAANRYLLETITAPQFGTTAGEWSVMDLLRGSYAGYDYLNYVPLSYYEDYVSRVEGYIISKEGNLDRNKSTEWSRATLAMSALGIDIRQMGKPGDYLKVKNVTIYKGQETVDTNNSLNYDAIKVNDDDTITFTHKTGVEYTYTNRNEQAATGFAIVPAGTYTLDREAGVLLDAQQQVVSVPYVEEYRGQEVKTHTVTQLALETSLYTLEKPFDFVEKLSTSNRFSYRQGINGPIWILIALDTAGYELYTEEQLAARGVSVAAGDINTKGKMIDEILKREITNAEGRVGGWALSGKNADPDITMMAVQSLAPYYLSEEKFKNAYRTTIADKETGALWDVESAEFANKYQAFKQAVERAVYVMAQDQKPNGGYASWGTINAESISQVIVGLTALQIDPLAETIYLPNIQETVSFIKEGAEIDGVTTNNMIDALLTFWAMGSGSSSEVAGFKHVTTGFDGGGGSGTSVNAMATDQAIYGLIAYNRFLANENRLYDMTDMINGEYQNMTAATYDAMYIVDGQQAEKIAFSPYEVLTIPMHTATGDALSWTTNEDGTGVMYTGDERLSTPAEPITLYAHSFKQQLATKEITDPLHTFTVSYNEKIAPESVSAAKVYVKDAQGNRVPTTIAVGEDLQSVTIAVEQPYEVGQTYTIYVEKGIQTADATKTLVEAVKMSFTVVAPF